MSGEVRARCALGIGALGVVELFAGAWMLIAPHSFYARSPTVSDLPPYNEHLVRDIGELYTALGVVLLVAALSRRREVAMTALLAYLIATGGHLTFHAFNTGADTAAGATLLLGSLSMLCVFAAWLLVLASGWR